MFVRSSVDRSVHHTWLRTQLMSELRLVSMALSTPNFGSNYVWENISAFSPRFLPFAKCCWTRWSESWSHVQNRRGIKLTRPDTRNKMRLVCVLFTFESNTGHTDGPTDTTSYRDATAHLKIGVPNLKSALWWIGHTMIKLGVALPFDLFFFDWYLLIKSDNAWKFRKPLLFD